MPKKDVDWRERISRTLSGLPLRGRPKGRQTGAKPGKRSIPKEWRDLDEECLQFARNELNNESWDDEQFVICAAHRARAHERQGDYRISKLRDKPTRPRKPRTHERRVRQFAKAVLKDARRELLEL
jgi:hypothetical protein